MDLFKNLKVFVVVYLIFMMMPAGAIAADLSQPTMENMIREELDEPVTEEIFLEELKNAANGTDEIVVEMEDGKSTTISCNELDPFTKHVLDLCPHLTKGEYIAIQTMFYEQLNTSNGQEKMRFYMAYLNNSSEIFDEVNNLTAQELYEKGGFYKRTVDSFDGIILTYGHLTSDEKIEFLLTHDPGLETTMKIFDEASDDKKCYIINKTSSQTDKIQTLSDKLCSRSISYIMSNINSFKKEADQLKTADTEYHQAVARADKDYDVYGRSTIGDGDIHSNVTTSGLTSQLNNYFSSSGYEESYQNAKEVTKKLNSISKVVSIEDINNRKYKIKKGDLLQIKIITNSHGSEEVPNMFKYGVIREIDDTYYYCEGILLKPVDKKGEKIINSEELPYNIELVKNEKYEKIKKSSVNKGYAILMDYGEKYDPQNSDDLFTAAKTGIQKWLDYASSVEDKTKSKYPGLKKSGLILLSVGGGLVVLSTIISIVAAIIYCIMVTSMVLMPVLNLIIMILFVVGGILMIVGGILMGLVDDITIHTNVKAIKSLHENIKVYNTV